jgi:MscS family membrane protein
MQEALSSAFDAVRTSPITITAVVIAATLVFGRVLVFVLRRVLTRLAKRTAAEWDDRLVTALSGPVSLLIALQAFRVAMPWLPLEPRAANLVVELVALLAVITVLAAAFRSIDLARALLETRAWAVARPATRSLLALGARVVKVAAFVLATLVALSQLGVSVASLIAGLGLGGLVIALAAQKTVENLFGTVSIGIDQPLREGDLVRVHDVVGTVERIGLRSTRIRTLDRTVVTIPNGDLANQRIESYTVRDRMRLACTIGLVYETTAAQLRGVIGDLERILRAHPKIWADNVAVRFRAFAESSLDVDISATFQTTDAMEFQRIREEVLIAFMEAIEARGTSMAFPTRTVHLAGGDGNTVARSRQPAAG